jgi:hypothetical protein
MLVLALRAYVKTDAFDNDPDQVFAAGRLMSRLADRGNGGNVAMETPNSSRSV